MVRKIERLLQTVADYEQFKQAESAQQNPTRQEDLTEEELDLIAAAGSTPLQRKEWQE